MPLSTILQYIIPTEKKLAVSLRYVGRARHELGKVQFSGAVPKLTQPLENLPAATLSHTAYKTTATTGKYGEGT